jgi:hypothetical protein
MADCICSLSSKDDYATDVKLLNNWLPGGSAKPTMLFIEVRLREPDVPAAVALGFGCGRNN